jgi:hypothetical protein
VEASQVAHEALDASEPTYPIRGDETGLTYMRRRMRPTREDALDPNLTSPLLSGKHGRQKNYNYSDLRFLHLTVY